MHAAHCDKETVTPAVGKSPRQTAPTPRSRPVPALYLSSRDFLIASAGFAILFALATGGIDANDRAPRGRELSVREVLTRIIVDWSGSWQAARLGNWLGRSPATKAALGC